MKIRKEVDVEDGRKKISRGWRIGRGGDRPPITFTEAQINAFGDNMIRLSVGATTWRRTCHKIIGTRRMKRMARARTKHSTIHTVIPLLVL